MNEFNVSEWAQNTLIDAVYTFKSCILVSNQISKQKLNLILSH